MNIKNRLLLSFVLVTFIPICIIGVVSYFQSKQALEQASLIALKTIADLKVERIEDFFKEQETDIRTAQKYYNIRTNLPIMSRFADNRTHPSYVAAKKMLDEQLQTFQKVSGYLDVMLLDMKGQIVYVSNASHEQKDLGKYLPGLGIQAYMKGQKEIFFSELFLNDRENEIPSMLITAPIHDMDNTLVGVIALEIDMSQIYSFIQETKGLGETGETLIAKKVGQNVLFLNPLRHDRTTALVRKVNIGHYSSRPIQHAVQGHEGSGRSKDYRHEETISVWRYIPSLDWGLVAKIDTSEAFSAVQGLKIFLIVIGSSILLLVTIIATVFARSITRPISSLQKGMAIVQKGKLDFKVKIDSGDEIASLAENFNVMIDNINHRNKDLNDLKYAMDQAAIVAITDHKGIIQSVNDKFCGLSKYSREELIGQDHRIVNSGSHSKAYIKNLWTTVANGKVWRGQFKNKAKDGSIYWVDSTIVPFLDEKGKPYQYLAIRTNITKQKFNEEEIKRLVQYDELTGLPNRTLFNDRLNQVILRNRWNNRPFAVMFIDLDRFKFINDTMGHAAGDQLLQALALRLRECLRDGDTVARMGGDEFTALLPEIAKPEDAAFVAEKMINALKRPFSIGNQELFVTVSIGLSLFPDNGTDAETLMKNADTAMYHAKESGRGCFKAYSLKLQSGKRENLALESALHCALDREEFRLYYQPLVDLQSGKIIGMEALLRWEREGHGLVSPLKFIPVAEKNGLILSIGTWVMKTATRQIKEWTAFGDKELTVSVNVSALQFQQADFIEQVSGIVDDSGIKPGALKLELTESLLMEHQEDVVEKLQELKAIGVQSAIDDFGTGYSSLGYLKRFPVESLKIDRIFIRNLPEDSNDIVLTEAIISLAHNLGLKVVAEGIETQAQLAFLQARECDVGQGYLFSRPVSGEDFTELLKKDGLSDSIVPEFFEGIMKNGA